jgi:L-rhamnose isomerase/sugar isomerase
MTGFDALIGVHKDRGDHVTDLPLHADQIESHNAPRLAALEDEYASLGRSLGRRGVDIEAIKARVARFSVALPSWGSGTGGTRFAKFPIAGEPTNIHEKLEDCAVVQQICRATPRVSPHFPWDRTEDYAALREHAEGLGLGFDVVNSNTFQDQPGQAVARSGRRG